MKLRTVRWLAVSIPPRKLPSIELHEGRNPMPLAQLSFRSKHDYAKFYMALPVPGDEAVAPTELQVMREAASKLENLGQAMSSPRFTDRSGDGPDCLRIAKRLRAILDTPKEKGT